MSAPTYLLHLFAVRPRLSTEVSKLPLTITFIPLTLCCQSDPVTACYVDAGLGVLLAVPGNIDHQRSSQGESYNSIILYTNCYLFTQVSSPYVVLFPLPSTIDTRYKVSLYIFRTSCRFLPWFRCPVSCWVLIG